MKLSREDKAFVTSKIMYIEPDHFIPEAMMINLLPRLKHQGVMPIARTKSNISINDILDEFLESDQHNKRLQGFTSIGSRDVLKAFIESDLVVMTSFKKKKDIVAPFPLHINSYKLRNTDYAIDRKASEQIYALLYHVENNIIDHLKDFFAKGLVVGSDKYDQETDMDIHTTILLNILDRVDADKRGNQRFTWERPLCIGQARILNNDLMKLLLYQNVIPRRELISYIETILMFHLGIYVFRIAQMLPDYVAEKKPNCICNECPIDPSNDKGYENCPYKVNLFCDTSNGIDKDIKDISSLSWKRLHRVMLRYVSAHIEAKKNLECAEELAKKGVIPIIDEYPLWMILQLLERDDLKPEVDMFFLNKWQKTIKSDEEEVDLNDLLLMSSGNIKTDYIRLITQEIEKGRMTRFNNLFNALFRLNKETGILIQNGPEKKFHLGSKLLEVLVQLSVIGYSEQRRLISKPKLLDQLLWQIENRYGLLIETLYEGNDLKTIRALIRNKTYFTLRLQEIGFYEPKSDAYNLQIVKPRYEVGG